MPSNFKALAGAAAGSEASDANFQNVTLLLHGDGSNGAQNNTFIDSSTNNFTITRNGNTTQGSFSPYGSLWSNYFDGSGDFLQVTGAALAFGSGSWTVEGWIFLNSYPGSYAQIFDSRFNGHGSTAGLTLYVGSNGTLRVYQGTDRAYTSSTISLGTWTHFAAVYDGTTLKLYLNGSNTGATNYTASFNLTNTTLQIGAEWTTTAGFINASISNFRVLVGTALYTANFTPPTAPLTAITNTSLLTCQSNRLRDASTNNFTITRVGDVKVTNFAPFAPSSAYSTTTNGGSAYFDGSGDYLLAPNNTALDVWDSGSGNFTVEAWIYPTVSMPNNCSIVGKAELNGNPGWTAGWAFQSYSNRLNVNTAGDTRLFNSNTTDIPVGAWSHVVLVKSSSTVSIFQNGTRVATITNSSSYSNTSDQVHIGTDRAAAGSKFTGWMAGIRMVKGTAVYDPTQSTLTVPTSPPTAVTNTNLLLNATNAAIFDSSMKNDLETVGNAQISTSVKKFGTGSMYFDGTGDRLTMPANPDVDVSSGNFTVEAWVYPTSSSGIKTVYANWFDGTSGGVIFGINSGTAALWWRPFDNASPMVTGSSVSNNTWTHIAVVRNGNTFTIYTNGVAGTPVSFSTNCVAGEPFIVGAYARGASGEYIGYIDELRITKGVARYTSNFTAPTAPFPNK